MKTYSLPITIETEDDRLFLNDFCRQQSIVIRSAYNDLRKGKSVKELEQSYKLKNNIDDLDSWFIRCGILKGKSLKHNDKVVFGGKYNFIKYLKGKLTKEQLKEKRTCSLDIQGEKHYGGNRKFELDIENSRILFKPRKGCKIYLQLPKIRRKWREELQFVQDNSICFSVRLNQYKIEIMVDEAAFRATDYRPVKGRTLGIDLNPDYIGYSITDFEDGKETIITKGCYETTALNRKSGFTSSHKKSKYLANKRKFEIVQTVKEIVKTAKHFRVETVSIEDLNLKSKDFGNKPTSRKNNLWQRRLIADKLRMDCKVAGIKFVEVNPAYSTVVGNFVHSDFDPISSSREIARRGYYKYVKGKFYPSLELVKHQWKEMVTNDIHSWKDLYLKAKTLDIRYRVPLDKSQVGCRITNIKGSVVLYTFI